MSEIAKGFSKTNLEKLLGIQSFRNLFLSSFWVSNSECTISDPISCLALQAITNIYACKQMLILEFLLKSNEISKLDAL